MEISVLNTPALPTTITDASPNKKADCYFYYYSSCNKGNACPFRHEPAALMNETMCVYWLKGNCSKPHCIYRHMEITKKRDKIACFFESQPGGCKKLHCPFLHNNVLDRPREEDVPNNPDLILPVKDSEADYETEQSENKKLQESVAAQLKLQRKLSQSHATEEEKSPEPLAPSITRKSFIVPLQDGESDSESVCVSPSKTTSVPQRTCILSEAERDWELERLREIQKEEGNLLGYSFTTEEQEDLRDHYSNPPSVITCEDEEEEGFIAEEEEEQEVADHFIVRRDLLLPRSRRRKQEDPETYVKRVLGNTLKKKKKNDVLKKEFSLLSPISNSEGHIVIFNRNSSSSDYGFQVALNERLGPKSNNSMAGKPSVKERLGRRGGIIKDDLEFKKHSNDDSSNLSLEEFAKKRLKEDSSSIKNRLSLKEEKKRSSRISSAKEETEQSNHDAAGFVIKSLADIRAEKKRQKQPPSTIVRSKDLPLSAFINTKKEISNEEAVSNDVHNIKIKTLAEIKAEKFQGTLSQKTCSLDPPAGNQPAAKPVKRAISPVSFEDKRSKLASLPCNKKLKTDCSKEPAIISFKPRKLTLKNATTGGGATQKDNQKNGLASNKDSSSYPTTKIKSATSTAVPSSTKDSTKVPPAKDASESQHPKNSEKHTIKSETEGASTIKTVDSSITNSSERKQQSFGTRQNSVSHMDSLVDEEELLLQADIITVDDEDIDEDELLL